MPSRKIISAMIALAAFSIAPRAQDKIATTQSAAPTLKVYSRETIVDVLVTDDKGHPVRGLTRSDFTVEEDNKPQPIRGFYEIDTGSPPPPAPTLPPTPTPTRAPCPPPALSKSFSSTCWAARPLT